MQNFNASEIHARRLNTKEVLVPKTRISSVSTTSPDLEKDDLSCAWPTGWDPKAGAQQAADPRKSRTCERAIRGGAARERRSNQRAAVVPSSRRGRVPPMSRTNEKGRQSNEEGSSGCLETGKSSPRGTWTTVLSCPCLHIHSRSCHSGSIGVRQGTR